MSDSLLNEDGIERESQECSNVSEDISLDFLDRIPQVSHISKQNDSFFSSLEFENSNVITPDAQPQRTGKDNFNEYNTVETVIVEDEIEFSDSIENEAAIADFTKSLEINEKEEIITENIVKMIISDYVKVKETTDINLGNTIKEINSYDLVDLDNLTDFSLTVDVEQLYNSNDKKVSNPYELEIKQEHDVSDTIVKPMTLEIEREKEAEKEKKKEREKREKKNREIVNKIMKSMNKSNENFNLSKAKLFFELQDPKLNIYYDCAKEILEENQVKIKIKIV